METLRLELIQEPVQMDQLLQLYATSAAGLSHRARKVSAWVDLPPVLRVRIIQAERTGCTWSCWADGERIWLFVAAMSIPLADGQDSLGLWVCRYREDGHLEEAGQWVRDKERWRRLGDLPEA